MSTDAGTSSPRAGSIFLRKTGPLANWMWMALLLLLALVYSMWRRNRAAAAAVDTEQTEPVTEPLPGDQTPPPVFILPQSPGPTVPININLPPGTPPPAPPGGGRPGTPRPTPPRPTPPAHPAVSYTAVKVARYSDPPGPAGPAWNSTLWGIAKQYGYGASGSNWQPIWNDPKNAALKARRGKPESIQPGDTIYVRRK